MSFLIKFSINYALCGELQQQLETKFELNRDILAKADCASGAG
jgi:hypothetical protein